MRLHRPSVFAGLGIALAALVAVLLVATAANAITWPWQPSPKPQITVKVTGSVSCSSAASVDGFGGNPASLAITVNGRSTTRPYPFKLTGSPAGVVFRKPHFGEYAAKVTIPAGQDGTTLRWKLQCRDQTGASGSHEQGSFTVGRKDLSRTICSYGGVLHPCTDPETNNKVADCAASIVPELVDSDTLKVGKAVLGGSWEDFTKALISKANPVIGAVVECWEAGTAVLSGGPAPTVPPTVAPLPTSTAKPLPTITPIPITPAGPTTAPAKPKPTPPTKPAPVSPGTGRIIISPCLDFHNAPNHVAAKIGCIPDGTVIPINCVAPGNSVTGPYGTTTIWDHTNYGSHSGYVSDAYVYTGTSRAVAPSCRPDGPTGTIIIAPCLDFHSGPNHTAAKIGCIPNGATITIECVAQGNSVTGPYGTTTIWDRTTYAAITGYVSDAYVYTGTASAVAPNC